METIDNNTDSITDNITDNIGKRISNTKEPDIIQKDEDLTDDPVLKEVFNNKADKNWKEYVDLERMEITCGEAPYLCSRYDVVSGEYIKPSLRIGLLDRKLIVISENINLKSDWYEYAKLAFKRTYGYDYQGDNVFIARGNLLLTFIDYYAEKFLENPGSNEIIEIAKIISWNIWQMDGTKYVVPLSCHKEEFVQLSIFEEFQNDADDCRGCVNGNIHQHNGIYSNIKDWRSNKIISFVDLIK
jgi:hypothetical protein